MSKKTEKKARKRAEKAAAKAQRAEWRPRIGFFADVDQPWPRPVAVLYDTYAVGQESYLFDDEALAYDVVA